MQPLAILATDSTPINWHIFRGVFFGLVLVTWVLSITMEVWRRGFSLSLVASLVEFMGATAVFAATLLSGNSPATQFVVGNLGFVLVVTGFALKIAWRRCGSDKHRGSRDGGPARL